MEGRDRDVTSTCHLACPLTSLFPSPTHPHSEEVLQGPRPHARPDPARPVPPAPVFFHRPMAEGQGKLSKPRQPSRVSALFPVPEPGPGGL